MSHTYVSGEGALWCQPDGPNTQPIYLGCHQLGDVDEPMGDVELIYCPDPSGPSRFRVVNSVQGAAGAPTTSVETDVTDDLDWLERAKCSIPLYAHMLKAGRKDVFTNYDRSFILTNCRVTSRGLTGLTARTPDDNTRSGMTFDLSAEQLIRAFRLDVARQTISETKAINAITFCNSESCRTDERAGSDVCQSGFAVADAALGAKANVLYAADGAGWTATNADPFANDENVIAVTCFELGRDSTRVLVASGTADVAAHLKLAYSDDLGVTWNAVLVGATDGELTPNGHSLFSLDRNNVWVGSDKGYIYYSNDAGLTFTAQEAGVIHVGAWNAIHFSDELVGWAAGAANIVARTLDGGESWAAITGPSAGAGVAINVVYALDRNRAWIGYANGTLYYTMNGGTTWSQRSFAGSGVGQVRDIRFVNEYIGVMVRNNASPVGNVLSTIDGGYTWEALATPANSGLNAVYICNEWRFYVVGEINAGTGYIAKGDL